MKPVAIVGGGISGLSAAYYLARKGIPCRLFEQRSRLGGTIRTKSLRGCLVEAGPDSWLADKAWMLDFVKELGIGSQVIGSNDSRRRTYVVRKGRTVPLPDSLRLLAPTKPWQAVTTPLYGPATKFRMVLEWFRSPARRSDRSVAEFVRDHFGEEAVEYLAQPILAGVYGSPPEALSAQRVIPRFVEYERRYGSILRGAYKNRHRSSQGPVFLTLRNGMGSLIDTLERRVAGTCEVIRSRVHDLSRVPNGWLLGLQGGSYIAEFVILAIPAHEAGRLISSAEPHLAGLLGEIGYTSSVVAALVYPRSGFNHSLKGFGFLVPRAEKGSLAACTWVSTKFDGRVPSDRVLLRAFLAGEAAERALAASEESVLRETDAELRKWMGFRGVPTAGYLHRWERAMPQYEVGHGERLREVEARLRSLGGLQLAGNGYDGLGIPDCVRRSERIAAAIATAREARPGDGQPIRRGAGPP
jgi:oxygen-dependent protoporphyrinogen oxidase